MQRIFNTASKPFMWNWNGKQFVIQPKGGGRWGVLLEEEPHPYADEDRRYRNRKIRKHVLRDGVLERAAPDYLDVDEGCVRALYKGKKLEMHNGAIKTLQELDHLKAAEWDQKQAELNEIERRLKATLEEISVAEQRKAKALRETEQIEGALGEKKKMLAAELATGDKKSTAKTAKK